jgi:hypothetical protein
MGMGSQRHASLPQEERQITHCTGGWVVPRAGLDGAHSESTTLFLPTSDQRITLIVGR